MLSSKGKNVIYTLLALVVIILVIKSGVLQYIQAILLFFSLFFGIIWLGHSLLGDKSKKELPVLVDYAKSFFPVIVIVLIIRAFIIQPFRVPSGSLEPTIMPGDFVAVNQFTYGLRLPVLHTKVLNIKEPKVGDIAVFRFPGNPMINYIKRVVGVPGDHIVYKNKILYLNGKKMKQKLIKDSYKTDETGIERIKILEENLMGVKHKIMLTSNGASSHDVDVIVPPNNYFMMGDNRDGSADSRYWGFVPEKNLEGKAFIIWFSWNANLKYRVNWPRIGIKL